MYRIRAPILAMVNVAGSSLRVVSAVRAGLETEPARFYAIVDQLKAEPIRFVTVRLTVWEAGSYTTDGVYDLSWEQAQRSMAERAGLIPRQQVEVVVLAQEPHERNLVHTFIDGRDTTDDADPTIQVTIKVLNIDYDDERRYWITEAFTTAQALCPAAKDIVTGFLTEIAGDRDLDLTAITTAQGGPR